MKSLPEAPISAFKSAERTRIYIPMKKNRKDNRICGKNEKSTKRGWDSGTGRDEITSGQRKEGNRGIKDERQGHVEYKRLNVQRKTSEEISRLICQFIYHQEDNFY